MRSKHDQDRLRFQKNLREITQSVGNYIAALDAEMANDKTPHGSRMATLIGQLEFSNDAALHFGLGVSFKTITARKAAAKKGVTTR